MSNLYILVGPPGCGKSTWVKSRVGPTSICINRDSIQNMFCANNYHDYWSWPIEKRVKIRTVIQATERIAITTAFGNGLDVYLDRTCMSRKEREYYIKIGLSTKDVEVFAVDFFWNLHPVDRFQKLQNICSTGPIETVLLERRMQDDRGTPRETWEKVIKEMIERYEEPLGEEGFKETFYMDPELLGF